MLGADNASDPTGLGLEMKDRSYPFSGDTTSCVLCGADGLPSKVTDLMGRSQAS
jgi:hypothetical protein